MNPLKKSGQKIKMCTLTTTRSDLYVRPHPLQKRIYEKSHTYHPDPSGYLFQHINQSHAMLMAYSLILESHALGIEMASF